VSEARLDGWVPFRIYWPGPEPAVECCYMGGSGFPDPFFTTTMSLELQRPFNTLFRRHASMTELAHWRELSPGLAPAGFIFHSSRCGSTLIARLLATLPENLVLSEPEPISALLCPNPSAPPAPDATRVEWLRCVMSALGQRQSGAERRLFVKFDPTDLFGMALLRQAFPGVPWIYVYRDPVEVLVSNLRRPAPFVTPGMLRVPAPGIETSQSEEEYAARALGAVLDLVAAHVPDSQALLVHHRELPGEIWGRIARHFGLAFSGAEIDRLRDAATVDAKKPGRPFQPDSESKNREATESVRDLAERWMGAAYRHLEALRTEYR
jgi:hypothetical protein